MSGKCHYYSKSIYNVGGLLSDTSYRCNLSYLLLYLLIYMYTGRKYYCTLAPVIILAGMYQYLDNAMHNIMFLTFCGNEVTINDSIH